MQTNDPHDPTPAQICPVTDVLTDVLDGISARTCVLLYPPRIHRGRHIVGIYLRNASTPPLIECLLGLSAATPAGDYLLADLGEVQEHRFAYPVRRFELPLLQRKSGKKNPSPRLARCSGRSGVLVEAAYGDPTTLRQCRVRN